MKYLKYIVLAPAYLIALMLHTPAVAAEGAALLNARCSACHQRTPEGGLQRISAARKTPEGWDMTLVRMMLIHGVQITAEERQVLVKHLADTQGLAPAETQDWRYILERQPAAIEDPPDADVAVMCARCHSYARVALQRRDADEWTLLAHFHQGQYPTTEYQALARDRNWWQIAATEMPRRLASLYPLQTDAWRQWQDTAKKSPVGIWRLVGHHPGKGRYTGSATVTAEGDDRFDIVLNLNYADGTDVAGSGTAVMYTGFEWRGRLLQGEDKVLQVLALSEDGNRLAGRWFLEDSDALGSDMQMVRLEAAAAVVAIEPPFVQPGTDTSLVIHGANLEGDIDLGAGITVNQVLHQSPVAIAVSISASADAAPGVRTVSVGEISADGLLTVYDSIDTVRVEPDYAVARVGANGGPLAPVPAQFDAVAYQNGADGEAGTDDDIRIGTMPATWSVDNAGEAAAAMKDAQFAGAIQANGLFMPAGAGPNAERRFGTNNVGELAVTATIGEGDAAVSGSGRLIVTVQRWNDPPIR